MRTEEEVLKDFEICREQWKIIKDFPNYQVSSCGRIKNKKGIIMKPDNSNDGYLNIKLFNNGKRKGFRVHRLVAQAFIPNPNNYPHINHRNGIKIDNKICNLEWCTRKYNATYNNCHFRHSDWEKKPIIQYDLQGNFIKEWTYAKEIEQSGIAKANLVKQCCRNQLCQTSNYVWRFKGDTFETRRIRKEYDRTKNLGNYARKQKI